MSKFDRRTAVQGNPPRLKSGIVRRVFLPPAAPEAVRRGRRNGVPIRSHSRPDKGRATSLITGEIMRPVTFLRPLLAVLYALALSLAATAAFAQSGGQKPAEPQKPSSEAAKEAQKSIDEIAEAARVLQGPAGNPECVWLGRRVVTLLWRDDLDTAFRHLDLYDRFGCPSSHIQATFRCLVRQGHIDPKAPDSLNGRVQACWLNPALPPTPAAAAAPQGAATPPGTANH